MQLNPTREIQYHPMNIIAKRNAYACVRGMHSTWKAGEKNEKCLFLCIKHILYMLNAVLHYNSA